MTNNLKPLSIRVSKEHFERLQNVKNDYLPKAAISDLIRFCINETLPKLENGEVSLCGLWEHETKR